MGISTHILDTTRGRPAADVAVTLERADGSAWAAVGQGRTDADGRLKTLTPPGEVPTGRYRISFAVEAYFASHKVDGFYPSVSIEFWVRHGAEHFHVPLLLNPFGYSTYRGS
jgi:5-hydroxyisourate hydrolase